ncbi:MAG: hypothetical protein IPG50_28815 [Myxococcales bacterium]|nr:hypothetical protein [Myxococcales bacterium]
MSSRSTPPPIEKLFAGTPGMTADARRAVVGPVARYIDVLFETGSFAGAMAAAREARWASLPSAPKSYRAPALAAAGAPLTLAENQSFARVVDYLVQAIGTDGNRALVPWLLDLQKAARSMDRDRAVAGSDRLVLSADELRAGYQSVLVSLAGAAALLTDREEDVPQWERVSAQLNDLPMRIGAEIERRIFLEATLSLSEEEQRLLGRDVWLKAGFVARPPHGRKRDSSSVRDWDALLDEVAREPTRPLSLALLFWWAEAETDETLATLAKIAIGYLKDDPSGPLVCAVSHRLVCYRRTEMHWAGHNWGTEAPPWWSELWHLIYRATGLTDALLAADGGGRVTSGKAALDRSELSALRTSTEHVQAIMEVLRWRLTALLATPEPSPSDRDVIRPPVAAYVDALTEHWDYRAASDAALAALDTPLQRQPRGWARHRLPRSSVPHREAGPVDDMFRAVVRFMTNDVAEDGRRPLVPWLLQLLQSASSPAGDVVCEAIEQLDLSTEELRFAYRSLLRAIADRTQGLGLHHEGSVPWRNIADLISDVPLRLGRSVSRRVFLEASLTLSTDDQLRLSEHVWPVARDPIPVGRGQLVENRRVPSFDELLDVLASAPTAPFSLGLVLRWPEAVDPRWRARVHGIAERYLRVRATGPLVEAVLAIPQAGAARALSDLVNDEVRAALSTRLRYLASLGTEVDVYQLAAMEETHETWLSLRGASGRAAPTEQTTDEGAATESAEESFFAGLTIADYFSRAATPARLLRLRNGFGGRRAVARVVGYFSQWSDDTYLVYSFVVRGREYAFAMETYFDETHARGGGEPRVWYDEAGPGTTSIVSYGRAPEDHWFVSGLLAGHITKVYFLGSLAGPLMAAENVCSG